jgi:hypothetical protein
MAKINIVICSLIFFALKIDSASSFGFKRKRNLEVVVDLEGESISHRKALISDLYAGLPYEGVVVTLPGVVEAEYFDTGGQNIAYNNVEANVPMPDNVIRLNEDGVDVAIQINDVAATTNPGASEEDGAMAVGMGMSTEWMRYTINVPAGATFSPTWRIATWDGADGPVSVNVKIVVSDGAEDDPCALAGVSTLEIAEANTGGWKVFESFISPDFTIDLGDFILAICLDEILNFEINYIEFALVEGDTPAPTAADTPAPTAADTPAPSDVDTPAPTAATFTADDIVITLAPSMANVETNAPTTLTMDEGTCGDENIACSDTILCCEGLTCSIDGLCSIDDELGMVDTATDSASSMKIGLVAGLAGFVITCLNF